MTLRFGIFDHVERRDIPLGQLLRERLEYLRFADGAGFWGYHKAEHHLTPLDAACSTTAYLAAAALATERIRLGPLVYLLPFHHPVRLIEDICYLDHLSGGRLEVGIGRGISPAEHTLWGHDPESARARSEETLAILLAGLGAQKLDYRGEFYCFEGVPIEVTPAQHPRPPMWYPGNVEFAAERGFHTVVFGPPPAVAQAVTQYREGAARASAEPINSGIPTVGALRHLLVGENEAQAVERGRKSWARYTANLTTLFRRFNLPVPMDPTVGGDFDRAREVRAAVVGTPEMVREDVAALSDAGADYYIGAFSWGDLTHEEAMQSVRLFATEVMPAFR